MEHWCEGIPRQGKRAFQVEVVNTLAEQLGYDVPMREVPFKRGLYAVQTRKNIVFFAVQRTAEREKTVQWVGPISAGTDYFYEWRSRPTGIRSLSDARDLKICVLNGSVHDRLLTGMGFTALSRNKNYATCFGLLKRGRVALAITSEDSIEHKLSAHEISPELVRKTPVVVLQGQHYIAMSKNIASSEVARWNRALQELKQSGYIRKLARRFLEPAS
ncbi:substrate-binding periplasmic protein [Dongshaea marina]|uniref:substrate-binding periplasmic protein n=1 Tax=Dongshaea marina TaxID=2047966 RepID=UPI00131F16EF|nr:transporter substrate-binding domain-containing protein [Dongshaea marina]